jgi:hypothetical protein
VTSKRSERHHSARAISDEREDLSEQEFMRRNTGNIDLQDGLLLAFFRHGQRGQQRREHRDAQHEDARAIEFLRIAARVKPKPDGGFHGCRPGLIIRHDFARVTLHQLGGVGVCGINE